MTRDLVPTVITNKNGVTTTVYRKPEKARSGLLAPVTLGADKNLYTLRKELTERLKRYHERDAEVTWRKRFIKESVAANDPARLERLSDHFDTTRHIFHEAVSAFEDNNLDFKDSTLFKQVVNFLTMSPRFGGTPYISPFIPLLRDNPEKLEQTSHYWNMIATKFNRVPEIDEVLELMNTPEGPSPDLPRFLAETVEISDTPVSDYNLVAKNATTMDGYTYIQFKQWDRQSMTFVSGLLREKKFDPLLAKRFIKENMTPRKATEFAALTSSVHDVLGTRTVGYEANIRGTNQRHINEALEAVNNISSEPIESFEDLAFRSAQLRFMLTIDNKVMPSLRMPPQLLKLLSEHSSVQEVTSIVDLFNERGTMNTRLAREHLADQSAASLNSGWL